MAQKSHGILTQPFSIDIDFEKLTTVIIEKITNGIETSINDQTSNCEIDSIEETDANCVSITGKYETPYTSTYYHSTHETPSELDISRTCECLIIEKILTAINNIMPEEFQNLIKINISENEFDATLEETMPDWDSMPNGYDDYYD